METRQSFSHFISTPHHAVPSAPSPGTHQAGSTTEPPKELPEQSFGLEQRQILKPQSREAVT